MPNPPPSLDEMRERLDLAREDAQDIIAESKRLIVDSREKRDRLRDHMKRERAHDQQLIAESRAMTLRSRQLLDHLHRKAGDGEPS